jgi:hypothetical protein
MRNLFGLGGAIIVRRTEVSYHHSLISGRHTVRSLNHLLTLAKRAKSFTDNSGSRYSIITSVGTSIRPTFCSLSDDMLMV